MTTDIGQQLRLLSRGHAEMALCCILYLIWWCIFFWPQSNGGQTSKALQIFGVVCIISAVIAGIFSSLTLGGVVSSLNGHISKSWIVSGAIILYVVLLLITSGLLKRPVTTELLLFVAWFALELCVANILAGDLSAVVPSWATYLVVFAAVVGFCLSLVCYRLYYGLSSTASFIDGCIPLIAIGVIEITLSLL
jgi:hypothetical protein